MKRIHLFCLLLACTSPAFGQDPGSETVTVEGSRIPTTTFGPIAWSGGPTLDPGHGCADPTCGGTIEKPEPGQGGSATTQSQKDSENKQNTEKAKKAGDILKDALKKSFDLVSFLKKWMKGIAVEAGLETYHETYYPDGRVDKGGWCAHYHAKIGTDDPNYKNPCIESKADTRLIKLNNNTYSNQLELTYILYDTCYWEKKCGPKYYTWVAGSEQELNRLLNGAISEQFFQ